MSSRLHPDWKWEHSVHDLPEMLAAINWLVEPEGLQHPALPVVAISGAFGGHFLRSASTLGARAALAKPFSGDDLLAAVRVALGT